MRTLLIVGSSTTRVVRRGDRDVVFTPRHYGVDRPHCTGSASERGAGPSSRGKRRVRLTPAS